MSEVIKTYIQKEVNKRFLNEYPDAPINDLQGTEQAAYRLGVKHGLSYGIERHMEFVVWAYKSGWDTYDEEVDTWYNFSNTPDVLKTYELFELFLNQKK